jgi:Uma2 family endonuclease
MRRVSYDDLAQMPEDGRRYELYDGEVCVVPSPILLHQVVAMRLWRILDDYAVQTIGLAVASPMDVVFSQYDVVQPDIVFFAADSMRTVSLMDRVRQPPDLAVEVLSPSTASNDRGRKMRMFQRYGVAEYWIVDPIAETIEIYKLAESAYELVGTFSGSETMHSAVLPDLTLVSSSVFPSATSVISRNLPIYQSANLPILRGQVLPRRFFSAARSAFSRSSSTSE